MNMYGSDNMQGDNECIGVQLDPYAFDETSPEKKRETRRVERDLIDSGRFVLNTAEKLLTVDVTTATLNPREPHDRALMETPLDDRISASVTIIPACHSPLVKWHGYAVSELSVGDEDLHVADAGLGDAEPYLFVSVLPKSVRVCVITPWIALEVDTALNSSLRAALDFGFAIRDYELQQCMAKSRVYSSLCSVCWNRVPGTTSLLVQVECVSWSQS
jgi:hypothetical protein